MAGVEAGTLSRFNCADCLRMKDRMKLFGCTEKASRPAMREIENGVLYRYWNCPLRFVPQNIIDFVRLYRYCRDFPSASMPTFDNCSGRFVAAYQYLETKRNEYTRDKNERDAAQWQMPQLKSKRG